MEDGINFITPVDLKPERHFAVTETKRSQLWRDRMLKAILSISVALNLFLAFTVHSLRKPAMTHPIESAVTGQKARPLNLTDLQGHPVTLSFSDSLIPTVVYYFRPDCHWCARNLANINLLSQIRAHEFRFIGLSPDELSLSEYVSRSKFMFPVYRVASPGPIDEIKIVGATPQMIVISQDGMIVKNWIGAFADEKQKDIENYFTLKLPGLLPPAKPGI